MFQIICQIGPLNIAEYGLLVAAIAAVGCLALGVIALRARDKQAAIPVVLYWTLAFVLLAMIPLATRVTIYSYGLMLAVAVVVVTIMTAREANKRQIKSAFIYDLVFWSVVGGLIGARLFYVFLNGPYFLENPGEIIMIQNGGLAWQGGLILGFLSAVFFTHFKKMPLPKVLDLGAPFLALGQSIGRIGCFLNGCCYGKPVAWGVYFPLHGANLYPTQIYLSAGYLMIFIVLRIYQTRSAIPGLVFALYLMLAASLRFTVEFFRADHTVLMMGLSIYQLVCFLIFVFAIYIAFSAIIKHGREEE